MPEAMLALIGYGAMIGFVNHRLSDGGCFALIGFSNSEQGKKAPKKQQPVSPLTHPL